MTQSLVTAVEIAALALAVYAAVRSLPRPLDLPWASVFDTALLAVAGGNGQLGTATPGDRVSPALVIGPGADWTAIAAWTEAVTSGLARRVRDVVLVDIGSGWASAMAAEVPGARGISVAPPPDATDAEGLAERLLDVVPRPSERMVLLLGDGESAGLLRALVIAPALRDRVVAVVAIGELIHGEERPDWVDEHFGHDSFDTELNRATPWISVPESGRPQSRQCWPDPPLPDSGRRSIDPIAVGPISLTDVPRDTLCRALWVLLAFRLYD